MTPLKAILGECLVTDQTTLETCNCDTLEQVQRKCGEQVLAILPKIGDPTKIGDEVYEHRQNVESLLRIMEIAESLCRSKQSRAYSAFSLPGGSSDCGSLTSVALRERYQDCC